MESVIIITAIIGLAIQPIVMLYFFNKMSRRWDAERVDAYNRVPADSDFNRRAAEFPREMVRDSESKPSKDAAKNEHAVQDEFDLVGSIGPDIPNTPFREQ